MTILDKIKDYLRLEFDKIIYDLSLNDGLKSNTTRRSRRELKVDEVFVPLVALSFHYYSAVQ